MKEDNQEIKVEILRYLSFWPWILVSAFIFTFSGYIYLRYANYQFNTLAKIEILDKAQDREMALPTSMTVFNRSMINLENEIGVLSSYSLHQRVVSALSSNIRYFSMGSLKTSENHPDEWFKDYTISFDEEKIKSGYTYEIETFDNDEFKISEFYAEDFITSYDFKNKTTRSSEHELPFELDFNFFQPEQNKMIKIFSQNSSINSFLGKLVVESDKKGSDQLFLSLKHTNPKISEEYLNKLIFEFDKDGISDRQLEYKRTMDFVDSRSVFLKAELEQVENKKLKFKQDNNLSDVKTDALNTISQKVEYNKNLFDAESQKDLTKILMESLSNDDYNYLPVNIGVNNININSIITDFNLLIKERELYLNVAGKNNSVILKVEKQLDNLKENIKESIVNYQKTLSIQIENFLKKEDELSNQFNKVPQNEKILRSIERELNVKESLFLLLLQKREEAAINFAVVKPSIKIIDSARTSLKAINPDKRIVMILSVGAGVFIPFLLIFLWFNFDSKIHTKNQLESYINDIPIIAEIPHILEKTQLNNLSDSLSRTPLSESIRMLIANLSLSLISNKNNEDCKTILITSSIKGEGKTLISSNVASILSSSNKKVLLIGADLRNPQIHQIINVNKDDYKGISDLIYNNEIKSYRDLIIKKDGLDIILSGTIPPNPTQLLKSEEFSNFIDYIKKDYDYVIIDSAPCLLVSDTLEISKFADLTLYVFRTNYTDRSLVDFINENHEKNKLKNINMVLNCIGNSGAYGYKYGYQYGYKYNYSYSYSYKYGYGYDYGSEKNK